ncbi:MAG: ABC transporter permease [Deltaproteobacteria bacterium]|nr:ABC transporter permease [Deltaproteobacteria bacterium]
MTGEPKRPYARQLALGAGAAAAIALLQVILARLLAGIPAGTRAQAVGAAASTLAMLLGGLLLGVVTRRSAGIRGAIGDRSARALAELGPSRLTPHVASVVVALCLAGFGLLILYLPDAEVLLFGRAPESSSVERAIAAVDAIGVGALLLVDLGAALGTHAGPGWVRSALSGLGLLIALQIGGAQLATRLSWDRDVVEGAIIATTIVSFLLTGALVSVLSRRLGFVELMWVAIGYGYTLYFGVGVFAVALLEKATIPEQQILVALSLVPSALAMCLLTVGSSIGFLLFGGGRFDPSFGYELMMALRYLKLRLSRPVMVIGVLSPLLGLWLSGSPLVALMLALPLAALVWVVRHAKSGAPGAAPRSHGFVGVTLVISVAGVCLGVMALIVVLSVMSGFEDDLKTKILGAHAHLAVNKKGDDFVEYEEMEQRLQKVDGVQAVAAFVLGEGMISSESGLSGTLVKGIEPTNQSAIADLAKNIEKGKLEYLLKPEEIPGARRSLRLPSETSTAALEFPPPRFDDFAAPIIAGDLDGGVTRVLPGIIIGRELAHTLRVYVGDSVNLVSPVSEEIGPTGPQPKLRRFRVAAIFYSGMYEFDSKFSYLEMKQAQRFFGLRGKATGVELRVKDLDETPRIVEEVKRRVGGFPFAVKDWREMNKELFSALLLEKLAMFIILIFIVLVASFLIVSTLVMIVLEKGREIAILKSMGASDASIMKVFVTQGLIVGFGGASLGLFGGVGVCLFIRRFGIPLDPDVFYITRLPVVMSWAEIAVIVISAIVITYLASIYPAMAAAQLSPVEGLRDE